MNLYPPSKRVCARAVITLLVSVFIVIGAWQLPATHAATTFTVNSLADTPDAAPGNGTCATAGGVCTLRAAIEEANSLSGDDTINFSLTGTINLTIDGAQRHRRQLPHPPDQRRLQYFRVNNH
jgi:CSLREA domain-containing protein